MSYDIGESVRSRLRSRPAVTSLVGERIFAGVLDQGADLPAVVVQVASNSPEEDLGGTNRIYPTSVLILAYADDRPKANELAYQIREDAFPANLSGSIEGMAWQEVSLIDGPTEIEQEPQDGSDIWRRITSQTFVIWNAAL